MYEQYLLKNGPSVVSTLSGGAFHLQLSVEEMTIPRAFASVYGKPLREDQLQTSKQESLILKCVIS